MKPPQSLAFSVMLPVLVSVATLQPSEQALAENTKPIDVQIAHVAYTAGQIDIKAAELAYERAVALVRKLNMVPGDSDFVAHAATTPRTRLLRSEW